MHRVASLALVIIDAYPPGHLLQVLASCLSNGRNVIAIPAQQLIVFGYTDLCQWHVWSYTYLSSVARYFELNLKCMVVPVGLNDHAQGPKPLLQPQGIYNYCPAASTALKPFTRAGVAWILLSIRTTN
jgi:hypothetical protein